MGQAPDERLKRTHQRDWAEIGRVFPFSDDDFDVDRLSPDGGHVFEKDAETGDMVGVLQAASHPKLKGKVPAPKPVVILQDQAPEGEKDVEHVELTSAEWAKLKKAHEEGLLDPDGNGTNRLISTLSLTDLGLGRIEAMLGKGRRSGASEAVVGL